VALPDLLVLRLLLLARRGLLDQLVQLVQAAQLTSKPSHRPALGRNQPMLLVAVSSSKHGVGAALVAAEMAWAAAVAATMNAG